ncbi:MAG: hypothetical protein ACK4TA_02195 [Saprospiraceae bacterium]
MPAAQADAIKALIAESRLSEAVEALLVAWKNQDKQFYHLVLQIKERYHFLQNEIAKGVISQTDADLERARISDALLFLTDRLDNPQAQLPRHLQQYFGENLQKSKQKQYLILVVSATLVLVLAFFFLQSYLKPADFNLKITLQAPANALANLAQQKVSLFFGHNLFATQEMDSEGKAIFTDIPNKFLHDSVLLQLDHPAYRIIGQSAATAAASGNGGITFQLEPVTPNTHWRGTVLDAKGNAIPNAILDVESGLARDTTDRNGNFALPVPKATGERVQVTIFVNQQPVRTSFFVLTESIPTQITIE